MSSRREANAVTLIGLGLGASAVLSAESPVIEAWLNRWVITAIAVAAGVALVAAAIKWAWHRWSS